MTNSNFPSRTTAPPTPIENAFARSASLIPAILTRFANGGSPISNKEPVQGAVGVLCRDGRYLVIQRAATVPAPGHWCFPGGTIEPGESIPDAVIREMQEEVGLTVAPIRQLYAWTHPKRKLQLTWWSLQEKSPEDPIPNPTEVAQTRWVTPEQMHQLTPMTLGNAAFLTALQNGTADLY